MIGSPAGIALPVGRICLGVDVGGRRIDAVFARQPGDAEPLSGATQRLAEELVAATCGVPVRRVRVAGLAPSGRPTARVAGRDRVPCVSVSHVRGLIGAAVCGHGSVGLDIVDPADAGRRLDVFFSPAELALACDDHGLLRAMLWSAKEAAFKAARRDAEFRPRHVSVDGMSPGGFAWTVRDHHAVSSGTGAFATVDRCIVAIATTAEQPACASALSTRSPRGLPA